MRNIIQVVIVLLILLVLVALISPAIIRVREAAGRSQCTNNLKQIFLAVHGYASTNNGGLPAAAMPNPDLPLEKRFSWNLEITPFVEANTLYSMLDLNKGWDTEQNRFAALTLIKTWRCPVYVERPPLSIFVPTEYVGITGIGTDAANLPLTEPRAGFFGYDRNITFEDCKRGTSQILLAAETSLASGAWTAAGPPTSRGLEPNGAPYFGPEGQFGGNHPRGANTVFADASVRFIEQAIDPAVWEAMATLSGKGNRE